MVAQQLLQRTVLLMLLASRQSPLLPVLLRHQQLQLLHSKGIRPAVSEQFFMLCFRRLWIFVHCKG